MSVIIGHSSMDERGGGVNGVAGDQTGKEVCTRGWYNGSWQFVLRPKSAALAEKSAQTCEAGCANNNIGYDMNQRNTLHTEAQRVNYDLSKVGKCECDCSSFMTVCAIAGGANISYTGNAPRTATMRNDFTKGGSYDILTESKYLTSDAYLKRGDILVRAGDHTVMVLSNGSKAGANTPAPAPTPAPTPTTKVTGNRVATKYAQKKDAKLAGTYVTTADLNMRNGAGTDNSVMVVLKKGTKVRNYGYYSVAGVTKWLYVVATVGNTNYTGFCSSKYLKKA